MTVREYIEAIISLRANREAQVVKLPLSGLIALLDDALEHARDLFGEWTAHEFMESIREAIDRGRSSFHGVELVRAVDANI